MNYLNKLFEYIPGLNDIYRLDKIPKTTIYNRYKYVLDLMNDIIVYFKRSYYFFYSQKIMMS